MSPHISTDLDSIFAGGRQKLELDSIFARAHQKLHRSKVIDDRRPWVCPLPELNGKAPLALDPLLMQAFEPDAPKDHPQVLLAYARASYADRAVAFLPFSRGGALFHFLPSYTPVFAAQDGEIVATEKRDDGGYAVVIDHHNGWASLYENLERIFCQPRGTNSLARAERVRAGDTLGYAGGSSLDVGAMKPLHYQLWRKVDSDSRGRYEAVDPRARMETWLRLPHTDGRLAGARTPIISNIQQAA